MATKKKPANKQGKLSKFIKAPLKILVKARDLYIKSMTVYADQIGHGMVMGGCPTGHATKDLPRSFSVNSTKSSNYDEDYRALLMAASTRALRSTTNDYFDGLQRQQSRKSPNNNSKATLNNHMPRSYSVGFGKIDEEKACDQFEDEPKIKTSVFSRSRSYVVLGTRKK